VTPLLLTAASGRVITGAAAPLREAHAEVLTIVGDGSAFTPLPDTWPPTPDWPL
jgi:hypothetical protein